MLRTFACVGVGLLLVAGAVAAQNTQAGQGQKELRGKIVRIDPEKGVVVIRTADNKEQEFKVGKTTKYYGADRKAMTDGLRSKDLRTGADVWYRMGGTATTPDGTISELRLGPTGSGTGQPGKEK